jgi:hypothetical protein
MNSVAIALKYSCEYLQLDRPKPLSDNNIESLIQDILAGRIDKDITATVYSNFKKECIQWFLNSKLNKLTGLEQFQRIDIINGCTQYIDNLYMQYPIQTIHGDYRYHERLGLQIQVNHDFTTLIPEVPLIIALPFPNNGSIHNDMAAILDKCYSSNIMVHIDAAWISASRDIEFDFSHPAIHSVGMSLSKGLGLGWNRIGLRWQRYMVQDAITLMNDFNMNLRLVAKIGLHFIRNFSSDYLWTMHSERYYKVCRDFNLTPTNSIHLALNGIDPVGVSPLIRYLENNGTN